MLFELAVVVAEQQLTDITALNWTKCLDAACERQRAYYDAVLPQKLADVDKTIALAVADNLTAGLKQLARESDSRITIRPTIPGYQWISNSAGDFRTAEALVEVKCTDRRFSTADYRQLIMYWLLCYLDSIERNVSCWTTGVLLNPRLNFNVAIKMADLVSIAATRRSPIDVVEAFRATIEDYRPPHART